MSSIEGGAGAGDLWLLKFAWPGLAGAPPSSLPPPPAVARPQVWRSLDGTLGYAYLSTAPSQPVSAPSQPACQRVRLVCTLAPPAASAGEVALYHYVVETDVASGKEDDFNAWYEQEHLPGLAAVPGTVRAARYVDADANGSPRYYACYDLLSLSTLESAPWLAVRGTPWSARVRPTFRNTRRTMFTRAGAAPAPSAR